MVKRKHAHKSKTHPKIRSTARFLSIFVMFAGLGVLLVLFIRAATNNVAFEAEGGSRTSDVSLQTDSTASGGQNIKFAAPTPPGGPQPFNTDGTLTGAWTVKFQDEFNGTSLDLSKWTGNWLGATNDITKPSNGSMTSCANPSQVKFASPADGYVHLHLDRVSCRATNGVTYDSSGVHMTTAGKFTFKSGYVEAYMYMPPGGSSCNNWPGFWTNGTGSGSIQWPMFLESDVMECLSGAARANVHAGPSANNDAWRHSFGGSVVAGDWHRYAADLEPSTSISCSGSTPNPVRLAYYYDGRRIGSPYDVCINNTGQYLIFQNVAGSLGGPAQYPTDVKVDYVRFWQH